MIDTSKYERHTPAPWKAELDDTDGHMYVAIAEGDEKREVFLHLPCWVCEEDMLELTATAELIADAPLLLAEVKRLREDNELYLVCINTSAYKHEPRSAFRELDAIRQSQGRQREHVGALRCIYGKSTQSYLKEVEE